MAEHDIPGPDWSDAPSWAQWWAVDGDGHAYWYAAEPTYNAQCDTWQVKSGPWWIWYSQGTTFEEDRSVRSGQGIDYRQTLRSRPEVQND